MYIVRQISTSSTVRQGLPTARASAAAGRAGGRARGVPHQGRERSSCRRSPGSCTRSRRTAADVTPYFSTRRLSCALYFASCSFGVRAGSLHVILNAYGAANADEDAITTQSVLPIFASLNICLSTWLAFNVYNTALTAGKGSESCVAAQVASSPVCCPACGAEPPCPQTRPSDLRTNTRW